VERGESPAVTRGVRGGDMGSGARQARLLRVVSLAVLALAQLGGVVAAYRVFVTTAPGQYLDAVSLNGAHRAYSYVDPVTHAVIDAIFYASATVLAVVVVVLTLRRRDWLLAAVIGVEVVGANATTRLLKNAVFDRPHLAGVLPGGIEFNPANTLPSGHMTITLSLAVALVLATGPRRRGLAAIVGAAYAALTGVTTLSAQWHRPSDAVAGCLVVGAWTAGLAAVAVAFRRGPSVPDPRNPAVTPLLAVAIVGVGAGALTMVATAWSHPGVTNAAGLYVGYAGAVAGIAGMCAAVVACVLAGARWIVPAHSRDA
jgi:hypothetical protein